MAIHNLEHAVASLQLNDPVTTISSRNLKQLYKCICAHLQTTCAQDSLMFNCLQLLEEACDNTRSLTNTQELASAFVAMLAWELGCQLPESIDEHPLLFPQFANLAKLTVALAYHGNNRRHNSDSVLQTLLETIWLINAFNFTIQNTWTSEYHLRSTLCTSPIGSLQQKEATLTNALKKMDETTRPFVHAILHKDFHQQTNRHENCHTKHLTTSCSPEHACRAIVQIVRGKHEDVSSEDQEDFGAAIRPYLFYHRLIETKIYGETTRIDLDTKEKETGTIQCPFCQRDRERVSWLLPS